MRIATYQYQGRRHVGLVSADGTTVAPLQLDAARARRGALPLIEAQRCRRTQLPADGRAVAAERSASWKRRCPLPRRNIFCVGRNYHAHAKELSGSVFKNNAASVDAWPIVFTKVPECVVGPDDEVRLPGEAISAQIDYEAELAVVIGKGGRNISRDDAHVARVRLHHRQRRHGARRADAPPAVGPGQVLRHLLPDGAVDRHRRRAGRHATRACAAGSTAKLRQDGQTTDLIFDIPTLIETCSRGITLHAGRHHRDRHAGRRRHGPDAAAVPARRRRGAHRDRRPRRAGEPRSSDRDGSEQQRRQDTCIPHDARCCSPRWWPLRPPRPRARRLARQADHDDRALSARRRRRHRGAAGGRSHVARTEAAGHRREQGRRRRRDRHRRRSRAHRPTATPC